MKKLLLLILLFTVLLALQAASSDEGPPTTGFRNYTRRRELTSQDDLDGVYALTNSFEQLNQYRGSDSCDILAPWPWIICSVYPTRVAFLTLSGYGLRGNLPDFSKLDGLQAINMSDNELDGPIPDFLGKLPHLYLLDLSNNKFSGKVPNSITSNENLYYNVDENPYLVPSQPKNTTNLLIVRLVIGISVAIAIKLMVVACVVLKRQQRRQQQQQLQAASCQGQFMGGIPSGQYSINDIGLVSMRTEPMCSPSTSTAHFSVNEENVAAASVLNGFTNETNVTQSIHDAEIAELLRQCGISTC